MEAATATRLARRISTPASPKHSESGIRENPWSQEGEELAEPWRLNLTPGEHEHLLEALTALTPREREVACAVCMGGGNEAVADRLCIAVPTLRTHLMRINQKLGTASKGDIVRFVSTRLLDGYRRREIQSAPANDASSHGKSSVSMMTA